jgi:hypothetical protein
MLAATLLPAALPLFAGGLGVVGLLAQRKKRQSARRQIQRAASLTMVDCP